MSQPATFPFMTSIHCYPIKSCRGVSLARATTDVSGLALDRRWMVVKEDGGFLSQRSDPRFATVSVAIEDGACLRVSAPGMPELVVPIEPGREPDRVVQVWKDSVRARSEGASPAAWFSGLLGFPAELVFVDEFHLRRLNRSDAPSPHRDRVAFSDAMPLLLVNQASLDDLNQRLEQPVPMNRFRPNLVVAGAEPWAEDGWERLRIGDHQFHGVRPCGRCVVTTTDQETGVRGVEPLRTLSTFRRIGERLVFGRYLVFEGRSEITVGDEIRLD